MDNDFILSVDVSNRLTRLGLFTGEELLAVWETSTPSHLTTDEAFVQIKRFLNRKAEDVEPLGAILSCVVPSHSHAWTHSLEKISRTHPLVVGPGLKTGVRMRLENPADVGSDRVANVVAARHALGAPVIAVSVGTTTNIEVVDTNDSYVGGTIAPGLMMSMRALNAVAARLPLVEPQAPRHVVGRSTGQAIQSGVVIGEAARIDGLLDRITGILEMDAPIVLTGHYTQIVAPLLRHTVTVDDALTLRGLNLIWHANQR